MSTDTAEIVFWTIAATLGLVWLIAVRFALSRLSRLRQGSLGERYAGDSRSEAVFVGETVLPGDREGLAATIAERLAAVSLPAGASPVMITERTAEKVAFERMPGGRGLRVLDSGVITLERTGGGTRVRYALSLGRFARIMRTVTYLVCFAYGGLFVIGAPVVIGAFVIRHEDPQVRWQVIQTVQMIHGVWPPFLIGALCSRLSDGAVGQFRGMLVNLAHTS